MKKIVSLGLSADSITAVEILKPYTSSPKILRYGEVKAPSGSIGDNEVLDVELVSNALEKLWDENHFSTKSVALGLSNRRIIVREHEAPFLELSRIKETLSFDAADVLPSQMSDAILDYYPIERTEDTEKNTIRGLLIAVMAEPIEKTIRALKSSGLVVEHVDLVPFGLARISRSIISFDEEHLMVNANALTSEVVAMRGGSPRMVRVLPNGIPMRHLTTAKHRMNPDQERETEGSRVRTFDPDESLLAALRTTQSFYANHGGSVGKIYLSGEGSLSENLSEKILMTLGVSAQVINFETTLGEPLEQEERDLELEASLIAVAGVGMRGLA